MATNTQSDRYDIRFSQDSLPPVEPAAAFWPRCPIVRPPDLDEVRQQVIADSASQLEPPFPPAAIEATEFAELEKLYAANTPKNRKPPTIATSQFLTHPLSTSASSGTW